MPQNTQIWQHIGLPQAHSLARNLGSGVKVAVIDTGVDLDHPALRDALAPKSEHWDFVDNDPVPQEQGTFGLGGYGHGTNVAGIIRQIAPRATILPLRVLGPDGRGDVVHLAAAINRAVANGANVINLSLGSENPSPAVEAALEAATAAGVMVVASAGNAGNTQVTYPASSARGADGWQRLSVTSINLSDARSFFASYGESIEVAAPGEAIYGPAPENQMAAWSGTSMAAPIAAGALALALGETLVVPMKNLADELMVRGSDLYNNDLNERYKDLLGDGRINLEEFLVNTILR
jgi:subtilisin family serine protease